MENTRSAMQYIVHSRSSVTLSLTSFPLLVHECVEKKGVDSALTQAFLNGGGSGSHQVYMDKDPEIWSLVDVERDLVKKESPRGADEAIEIG